MSNKVLTMASQDYFHYGDLFIKTRHRLNAEVILYGPDLSTKQIKELADNDIEFRFVDVSDFFTKMQYLKFKFIQDNTGQGGLITFVDFDTFFLEDWAPVISEDRFDLGITVNNRHIKNKLLRAYANGGVIFAKGSQSSADICEVGMKIMQDGGHEWLPEYDRIFRTLEQGRPAHKTHSRETLRWWVDQVLLSSFVMRYGKQVKDKAFSTFQFYDLGFYNCSRYNRLDPSPAEVKSLKAKRKAYIIHLKNRGRGIVNKLEKFI